MKLLVVDDHPVFREGLAALLQHARPDTTVIKARDTREALQLVRENDDLDAVFVDLRMPGMGGEVAVREIAARRPALPVIVISSSESPRDVHMALNAGARGYIPKSADPNTLLAALNLVLTGNIYVPPILLQASVAVAEATPARRNVSAINNLTDRQLEILELLHDGVPNKEIGARLEIAEKTVKAHVAAIFLTLNVVNRTQAANVLREFKLT
jgi:two-component system, NarL family, nitrate/nitrite response regulator NarL